MRVELEGRCIELPRPEKWVWYDQRYTMLDLMRYYVAVSPWLLPHLERRPVVYEAYPGTIHGPSTFEQDPPPHTPRWVKRVRVAGHERVVTYVIVDSAATLAYLVSLFMVTLHVWESTTAAIECPDFLLFDLDPAQGLALSATARAAVRVRTLLAELGIHGALVKSSGARGLHLNVPIFPENDFKTVREFTLQFARTLAARHPTEITAERDPRRRPPGAVYLDWGQMGRGMTIVPPYAPRACDGAPVSMPLPWEDIERWARARTDVDAADVFRRFTIATVVDALKAHGDLWASAQRASLAPALAALDAGRHETTGTAVHRVVRPGR